MTLEKIFDFSAWALILMLGLIFAKYPNAPSRAIYVLCLGVNAGLLIRAFMRPVTLIPGKPSYLTLESGFILFYYMIFALPYQLAFFGMMKLGYSPFGINTYPQYAYPALLLSTIGLLAFAIGINGPREHAHLNPRQSARKLVSRDYITYVDVGAVMLMIGLITLYVGGGFANANVARYRGAGATIGGPIANIYNVVIMLAIIVVSQSVLALRKRRVSAIHLIGCITVALWSLRILVLGDRNSFFLVAVAAVASLSFYYIKITRLMLFSTFGIAMLLYNAVEASRQLSDPTLGAIYEEMVYGSGNKADAQDSSINNTTTTLRIAIAAVPRSEDYGYGLYKAIGAAGVIPLIRGALLPKSLEYTTTADLVSKYGIGPNPTWGLGTSVPTDWYLDFGLIGVVAGLYLTGWIGRWVQAQAISNPLNPTSSITFIMMLAFYAEYPRYSVDFPLTSTVWSAVLLWAIRLLLKNPVQNIQ